MPPERPLVVRVRVHVGRLKLAIMLVRAVLILLPIEAVGLAGMRFIGHVVDRCTVELLR